MFSAQGWLKKRDHIHAVKVKGVIISQGKCVTINDTEKNEMQQQKNQQQISVK